MDKIQSIVVAALLLAAPVLRADDAKSTFEMNPAPEKFGAAVTFYASFDHVAIADLSNGNGTPRNPKIQIERKPGVFGTALLSGVNEVVFDAAGNLDLSKPGSVALWISPFEWKRDLPDTPYIFFLRVHDQGRQLMLARMGDKRNKEAVYLYAQAGDDKGSISAGNSQKWQDGQWHLFVANWRNESVEFSLDGGNLVRRDAPGFGKIEGKPGQFFVGSKGDSNQKYLVDEVMVFNRPLDAEEIQWLWETKKPQ